MLLLFPNTFPQGVLLYTSVTLESYCATQWGVKRPSPSSLKSVKASASSTLAKPLTSGAKEQALYHSWMPVDFHIWHYADLLLGALVSTFNPPRRNAAAYSMVTMETLHAHNRAPHTALNISCVLAYNHNLKLEAYTGIYTMCNVCLLWFLSSLLSALPASARPPFSPLGDPISIVLQHREVMMRNGVIMPVVKPQAAQQMCFRDPAFVSEWIRSLLW